VCVLLDSKKRKIIVTSGINRLISALEMQFFLCEITQFLLTLCRPVGLLIKYPPVPGPFKCNLRPNILHQADDKLEVISEPDQLPNACAGRSV
jgi:hypothetical protein